MKVRPITLRAEGGPIAAVLHLPQGEGKFPAVITCHGLFSDKDSRKYTQIATEFVREGLAVLRFDFLGCGDSGGNIEETTLTGRIADLQAALDFVRQQAELDGRVGLLGSSLGGCVAILIAAEDRGIGAVVTWATPARLTELFREEEFAGGYYRSGQFRLKRTFYDDLQRYDLLESVGRLCCPIFITHGDADQQVPVHHAQVLYAEAPEPKGQWIIPGGDHRLTRPEHRKQAIRRSLDWFQEHLGARK